MSAQPWLQPTVTQRIRLFLEEVGRPAPPWATHERVIELAWTTLRVRGADARVAKAFGALLHDMRARTGAGLPDHLAHPHAELLDEERIAELVAQLRAVVRSRPGRPELRDLRRILARFGAPMFGLSLALACDRGGSRTSPDASALAVSPPAIVDVPLATPEPPEAQAEAARIEDNGGAAPPAAEGDTLVGDDLPLDQAQRSALRTCLSNGKTGQESDLVALFRDKAPTEVAAALEAMLAPGGVCGPPPAADAGDGDAGATVDGSGEPDTDGADAGVDGMDADGDGGSDVRRRHGRARRDGTSSRPRRMGTGTSSTIVGIPLYKGVAFGDTTPTARHRVRTEHPAGSQPR
ncbi:MAG: hypothetical protein HY907_12360 [Deltaproteobacteria bacterium]|nr:hypothetical protein [Deltaproteobacteria bacterium]